MARSPSISFKVNTSVMRLFNTLLLVASAYAASSEYPTISSTIISSSSCESSSTVALAPSSFAYSNTTIVRVPQVEATSSFSEYVSTAGETDDPVSADPETVDPVTVDPASASDPASSSDPKSTIYEYETVTDDDYYDVVETVCDQYSNCYVTTELESFTTYTTTIDGILTVITSGVPYSSITADPVSTTTASDVITTLDETITVTTTHCSNDVCSLSTGVEVLTTSTATVDGEVTVYTTYCPLSDATKTATTDIVSKAATETAGDVAVTATDISTTVLTITSCQEKKCSLVTATTGVTTITSDHTAYTTYCPLPEVTSATTNVGHKTIDVITNNIVTETPTVPTTVSQSITSGVTVPSVSLYEGSGSIIKAGVFAILLSFFAAFI